MGEDDGAEYSLPRLGRFRPGVSGELEDVIMSMLRVDASRRPGSVSEVLTHALKVDFWDVDDMANKIIAVLRHPPLSQTLRTHGAMEARRLTWAGAAERCERIYHEVVKEMTHRSGHRAG